MSVSRIRTAAICAIVVTAIASTKWVRPVRVKAAQPPAGTTALPVQPLSDTSIPRPPVTAADRGNTYHTLEAQATRVTTKFSEATAVAERALDGTLTTRLSDAGGGEIASLRLHRIDATNDVLEFRVGTAEPARAARRPGLRPTLDWMNQQTYSLWKDHAAPETALEWQDTLMRPLRSARREVDREIAEIRTEWPDGYAAVTTTKRAPVRSVVNGRPLAGEAVVSRFTRNGVEVGFSTWYPQEELLAWSFPGLTEGYLDPSRLKEIGGWTFTPDKAWMNVQNFAFHRFHTLVASRGSAARREGWTDRVAAFFVPTVSADEIGCDGLHWLDGSVYRPCCDTHDYCYAKYGCSAKTWWTWWSSWQCDVCNMWVVWCFTSGGGILYREP